MINGREWILAARFGKTSTHILFRHVFDDAREVFHHVAIAVNDFMLLLIHELSPGIRLTFNASASTNQVERLVSRVPGWDGTRALITLLLCGFPHLLLCERIFFAQRLPVRSNLFAVVFDFLRNNSPGGAQRTRGAVAGFVDGQFEDVLAPG